MLMKKLNKKGFEIAPTMLIMIIAGALFMLGLVFHFANVISFFGEGSCDLKNIQFLGNLPNKVSLMSGPSGYKSRDEYSFKIPCGDRAYFVNLDKLTSEINKAKGEGTFADRSYDSPALKSIDHEPFILDEIESGTGNNFFIMSGGTIAHSSNLGKVSVDYPYNLCLDAKAKRDIRVEMEGLGRSGARIIPFCEQIECTIVPEIVQGNDLDKLLEQVCDGDAACIEAERQNVENARGNIDLSLKVSTCFPETTKVEFIIKPKPGTIAKEVKIIETIPTDCIDDLSKYLEEVDGGDAEVIIRTNPMLVWTFDTIPEEQKVSYKISKFLDDRCRQQLKAVVGATTVERESPPPGEPKIKTVNPHPNRFEPDDSKRGTPLPPKFRKIPEDKKGKRIVLEPGGVRELDDDEPHPGRGRGRSGGGGANTPPIWTGTFPPMSLKLSGLEQLRIKTISNIRSKVSDPDTPLSQLEFSVSESKDPSTGNDVVECEIEDDNDIRCESEGTGTSTVTVTATDKKSSPVATSFLVTVS